MRLAVIGWRHVPRGAHACHVHWVHHSSGRWNRAGEYGGLYLALHPYGALLELAKMRGMVGLKGNMMAPRDLVSVEISIETALDLRHPNWILGYPAWTSQVLGDTPECYDICHELADDAIALGNSAIRVPSSILPSMPAMDNVVVYPHTRVVNWSIKEGPDRFELSGSTDSLSVGEWKQILSRYPELSLPGMNLWLT